MHCPYCRNSDSKVLDSRATDDGGSIRRRRQCPSCERRFTTIEQMQLVVVKRSGVVEPFTRDKVINGVRKACKGRPVSEDQLARLGQLVEDSLRALGQPEIPADEVGVAILGPLRELDQVAYLRFASVYRQFRSVDDFEAEIALLRVEQEPTGIEPLVPDRLADNKVSNFTPHRLTPSRQRASSGPEPP
jgi:transcriptional repressor NrdR